MPRCVGSADVGVGTALWGGGGVWGGGGAARCVGSGAQGCGWVRFFFVIGRFF